MKKKEKEKKEDGQNIPVCFSCGDKHNLTKMKGCGHIFCQKCQPES
jgi:hypothetical protein